MINPFKKSKIRLDLIDISMEKISTGQVASYIIWLYKEYGFRHIGYCIENDRFVLYTVLGNNKVNQYFKDRCPGMVEEKIQTFNIDKNSNFTISRWDNGFEEVVEK